MSDRDVMKLAYGLLWHFCGNGSPNSKLATEARIVLRNRLRRDELAEGIDSARAACERLGVRFDAEVGGVLGQPDTCTWPEK